MKNFRNYILCAVVLFAAGCAEETDDPALPDDSRNKFSGTWECTETINSASMIFDVVIEKVGSGDSMRLKNFSNYGDFIFTGATVTGNTIIIPQQVIGTTAIPVQGSGQYSSGTDKINFNYVADGNNATAVYVRK